MRVIAILICSLCVVASVADRVSSASLRGGHGGPPVHVFSQEVVVYTCTMHPEIGSSKPGKCPKCGMKLVVQKPSGEGRQTDGTGSQSQGPGSRVLEVVRQSDEYTCPMHPDVRTTSPGKCPKCAMTLAPVTPAVSEDFNLKLECSPAAPKPNEPVRMRFAIFNPKTGEQVKDFYVTHEKLFHLFVVSEDLSEFQHIHPTLEPNGSFTIETVLKRPGHYKVYSDFYPRDGAPQVLQKNITTAGYSSDLMAARARLTPDASLVKVVDGMKIELKLDPVQIIAGQPVALKYHLTETANGQPVRNLVPYLGAWGHTLILSEDQSDYVHSHPEETVEETADKSKLGGGPDVTFNAFFPRPGNYRIWSQFQRGDTLTTVSFTVRADRLR